MTGLLKRITGKSFKELQVDYKFQKAEKLLSCTEQPIGDIINYLGYENRGYFNKKFREIYGCLPGEYRSKLKQ